MQARLNIFDSFLRCKILDRLYIGIALYIKVKIIKTGDIYWW